MSPGIATRQKHAPQNMPHGGSRQEKPTPAAAGAAGRVKGSDEGC